VNIGFLYQKKKTDHLYSFFLRWTPEREKDSLIDDNDNQPTNINQSSPNKGFVLLANDDPELTDNYLTTKKRQINKKKNHII